MDPAKADEIEAKRESRARILGWNPRDVLDLKNEDRDMWPIWGDQTGEPVPLKDISKKRLAIGQKSALNWGWKSSAVIQEMVAYWNGLTGTFDQRRKEYLEYVFSHQDELFRPIGPPFTWSDFEISAALWYKNQTEHWDPSKIKTDWIPRAYQLDYVKFLRGYFHHSGGYFCDGHGAYLNLNGDLTVQYCLFDELGGNALQLVNREDTFKNEVPAIDNRRARGGTITIERSVFGETGYSDTRGSYPISLMGLGRPGRPWAVNVRDVWVSCRWPIANTKGKRSRGGLLVEGGRADSWGYSTVAVEGFSAELYTPDRQILAINNSESVTVTGSRFFVRDGGTYIDFDRLDFAGFATVKKCGHILFDGNEGNCLVRFRDKVIGDANDKIQIETNGAGLSVIWVNGQKKGEHSQPA